MKSVVAPLFEVRPLAWSVPEVSEFDALLLTSANAARHGGEGLAQLKSLPCYCVGEATAAAARQAGFEPTGVGSADLRAILAQMAGDGIRRVVHLGGRDRTDAGPQQVSVGHITVYAAEAVDCLPRPAFEALAAGALALVHSPRAGALLSELIDRGGLDRSSIRIAAISDAAAKAAGDGWAGCEAASAPRDQALLELAAKLCNIDPVSGTGMAR